MSKKILILASFIGSGHKKAAEALKLGLQCDDPAAEVEIVNFFEYAHPAIAKAISALYFKLLNTDPETWNYIYDPREGKARVAEMLGLDGLVKGIRVKRVLDYAFDDQVESGIKSAVNSGSRINLGMKELLMMVGAKPEIAEKIYDEESDKIKFPYTLIEGKLRLMKDMGEYLTFRTQELFLEYKPDVVVCTQVLPCMFAAKLKEKKKTTVPLVAVITDFGVHSFWMKKEVDAFIIPYSGVSESLTKNNISNDKIHDFGIPIDKKFSVQKNKQKLKEKFGLEDNVFTLLFMGGGAGFGIDFFDTLKKLEDEKLKIQILIVCGKNEDLRLEMDKMQQLMSIPMKVFGFADNIDEMMAVSDAIITKPGGLTIAESMVSDLPMILVRVIQGQEDNNLKFLLENGMGIDAGRGEKLASIIIDLMRNQDILKEMKPRLKEFSRPQSASKISQLILSLVKN